MKIFVRVTVGLVLLVAAFYTVAFGYIYFNQRALQYSAAGELTTLADAGLPGAREVAIPSGDGVVNGWYQAPAAGKPLILYFKGNTGSFTAEYDRFQRWVSEGYGFLSFDYRGFPASPGNITEDNILQDSLAAFDWAQGQGAPIVLWGWSLGSGPSTYTASQRDAQALVLEAPFLSAATVAQERYPYLPVALAMEDQFPNNEWIKDVTEPVMVVHGTADATIEVSNGERLYDLVPNKTELWIVPGATHNNLWEIGIWDRVRPFFDGAIAQ